MRTPRSISYPSMLTAIIVIAGLSILILGHEAGHFFAAKMFGLRVDEFGFGFPPRIFGWRHKKNRRDADGTLRQVQGETEYSLNWLPFGGFVKIHGEEEAEESGGGDKSRSFFAQPAWRRAAVIAAGVIVNFILGWLLLSAVYMHGTAQAVVIDGIEPQSPAAAAGLKEGDILPGFKNAGDFIDFVNARRGEPISLDVARGGETLRVSAVPRLETKPGEGALGVSIGETGAPALPFFSALEEGLKESILMIWLTLAAFWRLLGDMFLRAAVPPDVVGPVGIFSVAEQASQIGFAYLFQLIALISLNLAVINVMPFPALDGGRLLFILIEKIKGSPLPRKAERILNSVGFALLVVLMAAVTVRDVSRLL